MTSRFELWNNLNRAMMPLAHWYALIDNQVILELQNKVIHEVLYNRYCLIKWAPMHEQVTLLRKLLSHIFEHYADIQDDGYISDEDIEDCPETFMPRLRIRRVLFPSETKPEDKPMPLDDKKLEDENVYIPNDSPDWLDEPSPDKHCAFTMNTRMDVNILDCHPLQFP